MTVVYVKNVFEFKENYKKLIVVKQSAPQKQTIKRREQE